MTEPLRALLARAESPDPVFPADELAGWPAGAADTLIGLGLLAEASPAAAVTCDACGHDHTEPVVWLDAPGHPRRAFIPCPETGRVRVPPDRLRRWAVAVDRLPDLIRGGLAMSGGGEAVVPGRVWRVGVVTAGGRRWAAFLARGMARPDAAAVAGRVPELRAGNALVFVPADVPPPTVWGGNRPPVVARLADAAELTDGGVVFDRACLDALTAPGLPSPPSPIAVIPSPAGTTWEDVALTVEDHHLRVAVGGTTRRLTLAEAGFADDRTGGGSGRSWALLTLLAKHGGILPHDRGSKPARVKQAVSRLRKALTALLQLDADPFHPVTKGKPYRARFRVGLADPSRVPLPPGAGWEDVTLTETTAGTIAVAVPTAGRSAVYQPGSDDEPGGWGCATDGAEDVRTYRLADWRLATAAGSPSVAGAALLGVLRGRGRVRRPGTDPGLLALGKVLTAVFGLAGPPFTFDPATGTWVSAFTADGAAGGPDR